MNTLLRLIANILLYGLLIEVLFNHNNAVIGRGNGYRCALLVCMALERLLFSGYVFIR